MSRPASRCRSIAIVLACVASASPATLADGPISFNRDIRPILSNNCFSCHGPDEAERQADLRLDLADTKGNRFSYCANASEEVVAEIRAMPSDYYVNVHNDAFPGGAVRGQLGD